MASVACLPQSQGRRSRASDEEWTRSVELRAPNCVQRTYNSVSLPFMCPPMSWVQKKQPPFPLVAVISTSKARVCQLPAASPEN